VYSPGITALVHRKSESPSVTPPRSFDRRPWTQLAEEVPFLTSIMKGHDPYVFWSGSAAAQSLVHRVSGVPSLLRGSPVAEMCSPLPNRVADDGIGELTSMY